MGQVQSTLLYPAVKVAEAEIGPMNQLIDVLLDVRVHAKLVKCLPKRFMNV